MGVRSYQLAWRSLPQVEELVAATLRAVAQVGLRRAAAGPSGGQELGSLGAGAGAGTGTSPTLGGTAETEGESGAAGWRAGAGGAGGGRESSSSSGADGLNASEKGFNFLHLPMENGWLEHCA